MCVYDERERERTRENERERERTRENEREGERDMFGEPLLHGAFDVGVFLLHFRALELLHLDVCVCMGVCVCVHIHTSFPSPKMRLHVLS